MARRFADDFSGRDVCDRFGHAGRIYQPNGGDILDMLAL